MAPENSGNYLAPRRGGVVGAYIRNILCIKVKVGLVIIHFKDLVALRIIVPNFFLYVLFCLGCTKMFKLQISTHNFVVTI